MPKVIAGGRYSLNTIIAAGSFGKVYEDPPYAIKQMKLPHRHNARSDVTLSALIANQIRILTQLCHDNIVKLYQVVEESDYIYLVMELCQGDLRRYTERGPVSQSMACQFLRQMLQGYGQLAHLGVVHRDLKPANVLLKQGCLKLADFGMSKLQEQTQLLQSHVGTPYYMAPQLLQRIEYTRKCDVWSLGIIFYQLLFGCLPWMGKNQQSLLVAIMTQPLKIPKHISEGVKNTLEGMLAISEARRLSWKEVDKMLDLHQKMEFPKEERTFHWSIVKQMLKIEADRHSQLRYKLGYDSLTIDQKKDIRSQLSCIFREEEAYILNFLPF